MSKMKKVFSLQLGLGFIEVHIILLDVMLFHINYIRVSSELQHGNHKRKEKCRLRRQHLQIMENVIIFICSSTSSLSIFCNEPYV